MNSTGDGKPSWLPGRSPEGPGTAWSPQGGSQLTNALIFTLSYQSSAQSAVTWGRHEAKVEGSWVPPRGDGNRPRPALCIKPAPPRETWQVPVSRGGRGPGRDWPRREQRAAGATDPFLARRPRQCRAGPRAERGGEGSGWNVPGGPRGPRPHTPGRGLSAPGSLAAWEPPKSCSGRAERAPGRHSPPGRPAGAPGRLRLVVAELDTQPPPTS